ncbi:hypothetical protein PanWU01x14_233140 [Parasponia andersonii]|uniref:Uncharacterized protein n=1 Tax=Parasponia andersonii TaxID=3476 RepID=A0A2P5BJS9_PARAD|nr:hypothetical protein PanWU01x14_233140 [Parasponia andersonii]
MAMIITTSILTTSNLSLWLKDLYCLPSEIRVITTKMAISGSLLKPEVASSLQVKINVNHPRPKVKIFLGVPIYPCLESSPSCRCPRKLTATLAHQLHKKPAQGSGRQAQKPPHSLQPALQYMHHFCPPWLGPSLRKHLHHEPLHIHHRCQ